MNETRIILGSVLALVLVGVAATGAKAIYTKRVQIAEQQAAEAKKQADDHANHAKASDQAVSDLQTKVSNQSQALDRLTQERKLLLAKLDAGRKAHPDPGGQSVPKGESAPDVRDKVIAKDAEVIEAQAKVIEGYKAQTSQLVISRDQWKAAYEAENRRAVGLQIALDAQKHVSGADKWLGRVQGVAIGFGVGYLAGRLH